MNRSDYIRKSFVNAGATFIYISAVAWFMINTKTIFGEVEEPNFIIPVFMLLLFVISASITGLLVLGKPIQLYWDGLKKEAIKLLFSTLGWLVAFLLIIVTALVLS